MSHSLGKSWRHACAVLGLVALGILAGCGSSSSSSSISTAASTPAAAGTSSTASTAGDSSTSGAAEAKRIVTAAETTAAFGPTGGVLKPSDITAADANSIKPTPYKAGSDPGKSVVAISCASISPSCAVQVKVEADALTKVGWKATVLVAGNDYSPASFQRAMTQAIAMKPYAIITNGMAGAAIGPQLAAAKKAGIFTVGTNVNEAAGAGYDQYNPAGYTLSTATIASELVDSLGPKLKMVWYNAPQFPFLAVPAGVTFGQSLCSTCDFKRQDVTSDKISDPVAYSGLVSATIQGNPDIQAVALPGDTPLVAGKQAISQSSNPKVVQITNSLDAASAEGLKQGAAPIMIGFPVAWSSIVSADMVLRHATGQPVVPENDSKIGVMIMQPNELPAGKLTEDAITKWSLSKFDYFAPYSKAWGVDLSSIVG